MDDTLKLKIESYIGNTMSNEEQKMFEIEMENNAELKKEVALAKELNHFLRDEYLDHKSSDEKSKKEIKDFLRSKEAKNLETVLTKVKEDYHFKESKPRKSNYLYAIAAVFLLFISVISYNTLTQNTSEELFTQYYSANDLPSIIKRDNQDDKFKQGVLKFQNKNYLAATNDFKQYILNNKKVDKRVYLYSGIANMEQGNYDIAIQELDKIIHSDLLGKSKGLWFKALLYLKKGDIKMSKTTLKTILKSKDNFKYVEAKKLLDKL